MIVLILFVFFLGFSKRYIAKNYQYRFNDFNISRIVGGRTADEDIIEAFSEIHLIHHNSFGEKSYYSCGGNLIARKFVLTAAHCVLNRDKNSMAKDIKVLIGQRTPTDFSKAISAESFYLLKTLDTETMIPDISIIELVRSVNIDEAKPIQVSRSLKDAPRVGEEIIAAGFGLIRDMKYGRKRAGTVQQVKLVRREFPVCRSVKSENDGGSVDSIRGNWICAVSFEFPYFGGAGTCHGDSGGPMFVLKNGIFLQTAVTTITWHGCGSKNSVNWGIVLHPYTRYINQVLKRRWEKYWVIFRIS